MNEVIKILEIQSFNDIITNSSTEIYSAESNKNLEKTLDELGIDWFSPSCFSDILGVLKRDVCRKFRVRDFLYYVELGINRSSLKDNLPRLTSEGYRELIDLGYCDDTISEFFDPIYRKLGVYGKVYITYPHMGILEDRFSGHSRTAHKFKSLGTD